MSTSEKLFFDWLFRPKTMNFKDFFVINFFESFLFKNPEQILDFKCYICVC